MVSTLLFLGGVGFQELLLISFLFIVPLSLSIAAALQVVKSKQESAVKTIWLLVIVFFPFIGSIIYLLAGRRIGQEREAQ